MESRGLAAIRKAAERLPADEELFLFLAGLLLNAPEESIDQIAEPRIVSPQERACERARTGYSLWDFTRPPTLPFQTHARAGACRSSLHSSLRVLGRRQPYSSGSSSASACGFAAAPRTAWPST